MREFDTSLAESLQEMPIEEESVVLKNPEELFELLEQQEELPADNIASIIEDMDESQFRKLLYHLNFYEHREDLPSQVIKSYLNRGFEIAKEMKDKNKQQEFLATVERLMIVEEGSRLQKEKKETITDKAVSAYRELYRSHQEVADVYWMWFSQDAQMITPSVYLEFLRDMYADPNVSQYWKGTAKASFHEGSAAFGFTDYIEESFEFNEDTPFHEKVKWIVFLNNVVSYGENTQFDWSGKAMARIRENLQEVAHKGTHNHLLDEYLGHLLEDDSTELVSPEEMQTFDTHLVSYRNLELMSEEERGELDIKLMDFQVLKSDFFQELVSKELGIDVSQLDLRVKMWFMDFVKNNDDETFGQVKDFVKEYGLDGIQTFLSLEGSEYQGKNILAIAEWNTEAAHAIFAKFNELSCLLAQTDEEISGQFFTDGRVVHPSEQILKRAQKLLVDQASQIEQWKAEGIYPEEKVTDIKNQLSNIA